MSSVIFDKARKRAMDKLLDWTGDTYKVMLCDNTYAPNAATETYVSDAALAKELTGASYTANGTSGRITLANKTTTIASNRCEARADNVTYAALTGQTVGWVVVYQAVGADSANLLVCAIDIADVITSGSDLPIKWNGSITNGAVFKI